MRIRAGIVLIQDTRVALIERHRAGLDYFVFPGGGVDEGETPEQAAGREAMEELGVEVSIGQKVAVVHLQIGGEFGTGTGEEYTNADPASSEEGIYIPVWMPVDELLLHQNIYPADLARLVVKSMKEGWAETAATLCEEPKKDLRK